MGVNDINDNDWDDGDDEAPYDDDDDLPSESEVLNMIKKKVDREKDIITPEREAEFKKRRADFTKDVAALANHHKVAILCFSCDRGDDMEIGTSSGTTIVNINAVQAAIAMAAFLDEDDNKDIAHIRHIFNILNDKATAKREED